MGSGPGTLHCGDYRSLEARLDKVSGGLPALEPSNEVDLVERAPGPDGQHVVGDPRLEAGILVVGPVEGNFLVMVGLGEASVD